MTINDLSKYIIIGIFLLIIIIMINVGSEEKSMPENYQPQISQEQSVKTIQESEIKEQQEQQTLKETKKKIQKEELCDCVYRNCNDENSCNVFCQSMSYSKCGGNVCWEQDSGYETIKHLIKYSSENYCQCSGKLKGIRYEDEIPYGQCYSTGSCNLVCSWINQTCLKAGCSCCK